MLSRKASAGSTLVELLIAGTVILLASIMGVMYVTQSARHVSWSRDLGFARQKAMSILDELRSYVEGGGGSVAADLDGFDDGTAHSPVLTITTDPANPGAFVTADHPISGNVRNRGDWVWYRRITVRPFTTIQARDVRLVTVRIFRKSASDPAPGDRMAEVSSVIRTIGDAYATTQVYDVYLLALENVPGWWVYMDAIQPFIEATLADLESRNRGLQLRTHWITKLGYGRDDEYVPYTNEVLRSTDTTPWVYTYPGRMPDGEASMRYYVPSRFRARVNIDGTSAPQLVNGYELPEGFSDTNTNGRYDWGEIFVDSDGDGAWSRGNEAPYALADMHNHCKRWPEAAARFQDRIDNELEDESTPTLRLLLDRMVAEPDRYHNAILINLHGELLPLPPVRNYSDAAKSPENKPGWRAVTHPELLRPRRIAGNDASSDAPRYRVHAYKTSFLNTEALMTQAEPFEDANGNGAFDSGETFVDWNADGARDEGVPITLTIPGGDFTQHPNDTYTPSIRILRLAGGVDADADGTADAYEDWTRARQYPEVFEDLNGDGRRQVAEPWLDLDGNGVHDAGEPHRELDGDSVWTAATEALVDADGDDLHDSTRPAESFSDDNGNGRWDAAEAYWDENGNGVWDPPSLSGHPYVAWSPSAHGIPTATAEYIAKYGEPFADLDGDEVWDAAESFYDGNKNGVRDGGFERGEMWFELSFDATANETIARLHGTPLETPYLDDGSNDRKGLPESARLYDLDYVPCPTPASAADADRFGLDLFSSDADRPKNTARWLVDLPLASIRQVFATAPGLGDGDHVDRIVTVETRIGRDRETGVLWPVRSDPPNVSRTYAYFFASADSVPYSERYQFLGDPRHSPYADTDAQGATAPHGYNWFFDDLQDGTTDAQPDWAAFDGSRLGDGWAGRGSGHDVARLLSWFRAALTRNEAIYTTLTGFSYYYLSLGGDVGYDAANGYPDSIPVDGTPYGLTGSVNESTLTDTGTSSIRGSRKFARSNAGASAGLRSGGYWWAKPWIGELWADEAYATQWRPYGNLQAGTDAGAFRLVRRGDVTAAQQPAGTSLIDLAGRLAAEGCTSVFNIGTSQSATFHHQYADDGKGRLVDDGPLLAETYSFPLPSRLEISRPFGLSTDSSGGVGPEFAFTDSYPRYQAQMVRRFYDHENGQTGSALVRLQEPGGSPRGGYLVVNGLERTQESGSAFIARYSVLSLIHGFFAAGAPGTANRVRQLPRVEVTAPTLVSELVHPVVIPIQWRTSWTRWDGRAYTDLYPGDFVEDETDLVYVLMYSSDGGDTWRNMRDDLEAIPGQLPWVVGVGADPARVVIDSAPGADETWNWPVPADKFPAGSYLIRVEGYRGSETLHYAQHMEKIYVQR